MDARQFLILGVSMLAASMIGPVTAQEAHQPMLQALYDWGEANADTFGVRFLGAELE
ncbi:hypothetical protein FBZ93_10970 [Bradyrhizobium macuxiense]|uniref:Uncharacterized protein n=1 Tax=Bradyrhizobium macuxiense TaxID=1755647 RepID=A0A560LMT0_9BRAD|nr:hypothetical protein [Bradyrhizobium macuxiense]TWB94630.1 hypothetical protein FBZ93_10970 [Bradyrhizobium macuxiense]